MPTKPTKVKPKATRRSAAKPATKAKAKAKAKPAAKAEAKAKAKAKPAAKAPTTPTAKPKGKAAPTAKPTAKRKATPATKAKPKAKAKATAEPITVNIALTEPLPPNERSERYEDPLFELLEAGGLGGPGDGGGTLCSKDGEVQEADFDVEITSFAALAVIRRFLAETGAAKGSSLRYQRDGEEVEEPVGITEGLAIYLDGVTLPPEVYTPTCLEELLEKLAAALGDDLDFRGSWQGPRETALYFYGLDAEQLFATLEPVLRATPLAQNARVVIRHLAKQGAREVRLG